jgi:hypothetical protein
MCGIHYPSYHQAPAGSTLSPRFNVSLDGTRLRSAQPRRVDTHHRLAVLPPAPAVLVPGPRPQRLVYLLWPGGGRGTTRGRKPPRHLQAPHTGSQLLSPPATLFHPSISILDASRLPCPDSITAHDSSLSLLGQTLPRTRTATSVGAECWVAGHIKADLR